MSDAVVAAIASMIGAACTAVVSLGTIGLNNQHHEKMKRMELFEARRSEIVEQYVRYAKEYAVSKISGNFWEYAGMIYLYTDKKLWVHLNAVESAFKERDFEKASEALQLFCESYNKLQRVKR